jgi:hypothetical protein
MNVCAIDVSIEVLHIYRPDSSPGVLKRHAEREARWVEAIASALERVGRTWSICMLIDDTDPRCDPEDIEGRFCDAWRATGLPLDHAVRETECAMSIGRMLEQFTGEIGPGLAGALGTSVCPPPIDVVAERRRWLTNGEPSRPSMTRLGAAELTEVPGEANIVPARAASSRTHCIHLDVELWSTVGHSTPVWSCAILAAWWQLLRLGAPHIQHTPLSRPVSGGRKLPLAARSTLTLLPARMLEVEHAVRAILERVIVPGQWLARDVNGKPPSTARDHLDRIGYVFTNSSLDG